MGACFLRFASLCGVNCKLGVWCTRCILPDRSFLGSAGGGGSVAIAHLGLYTSDIGLGQWVYIIHETVCRQW